MDHTQLTDRLSIQEDGENIVLNKSYLFLLKALAFKIIKEIRSLLIVLILLFTKCW